MIPFQRAWELLKGIDCLTAPETVTNDAAVGRISHKDVHAYHDSPPFDQSRYDGYALGDECEKSVRHYTIVTDKPITAGDGASHTLSAGEAIPIMTGAPLPSGTRAVVPEEWCSLDGMTLAVNRLPGKNSMWLKRGSNFSKGELYLRRGEVINPVHVAFMALDGKTQIDVFSRPTLLVISSGDELTSSEEPMLMKAKIRNSHPALIQALLAPYGQVVKKIHIPDRADLMEKTFTEALRTDATIIITTGGLGRGVKDLTRKVLHQIGCTALFEGINAIPIGTFSCYQYREKIVFALPGGMVGVLLLSKLYILPFIRKVQGLVPSPSLGPFRLARLRGKAAQALLNKRGNGMIRFVKARLWTEGGKEWVAPLDPLAESLTEMNAFILSGNGEMGEKSREEMPVFPLWES